MARPLTIRPADVLVDYLRTAGTPLLTDADLDPLITRIGTARFVLLGEATHGTSEFYVQGLPDAGSSPLEAFEEFRRWPTWMWANYETASFIEWLHRRNADRPPDHRTGFYGLDVYSLWESLDAVMGYLRVKMPDALEAAMQAYRCFEPYGAEGQRYAWATRFVPSSCEDEVVAMLGKLRHRAPGYNVDGRDGFFNAEQNALVVRNAERYYRAMMGADADSWNIRDRHMADTLERIGERYGTQARGVVWEHNTHIGDARATDMVDEGMVNVGQLMRERRAPDGVVLVGFGTYHGTVVASAAWGAEPMRMAVPEAMEHSWEDLFHRAGGDRLVLFDDRAPAGFTERRGHRAIGVVYNPRQERRNYVPTVLPRRYDAFLYIDETHALSPLRQPARPEETPPATYPKGQ